MLPLLQCTSAASANLQVGIANPFLFFFFNVVLSNVEDALPLGPPSRPLCHPDGVVTQIRRRVIMKASFSAIPVVALLLTPRGAAQQCSSGLTFCDDEEIFAGRLPVGFEALHARAESPAGMPCTVQAYATAAEGVEAQQSRGPHPFVVRDLGAGLQGRDAAGWLPADWQGGTMAAILDRFGSRPNHYGFDGSVIRDDWKFIAQGDRTLMGVNLNDSELPYWAPIFDGTTNAEESAWGAASTAVAVILGKRGVGVQNDDHLAVFFYHLTGRKVWTFHREYVSDAGGFEEGPSPTEEHFWPCTVSGVSRPDSQTCVLGSGDLLFAPRGPQWADGWHHSTCHLDAVTTMLIQFDKVQNAEARDSDAGY